MSGLTHIAGGLLAGSAITYYAAISGNTPNVPVTGFFLTGCMSGAIICDTDEPKSLIGQVLLPFALLLRILHWTFRILALPLPQRSILKRNLTDASYAFAHRGLMHWPTTLLIFTIGLSTIAFQITGHVASAEVATVINNTIYGVCIGMFSHLLYDALSGTLPLLAPFSRKRFGLRLVESNGFIDKYIVRTLSIISSIYLLISI